MYKFEKEFRADNPQTIGETDKYFDLGNYTNWLEEKLTWIPITEKEPEPITHVHKQPNGNTLHFYDNYLVKGYYNNEAKSEGKMSSFYMPSSVYWYFNVPCNFTVTHWRYIL